MVSRASSCWVKNTGEQPAHNEAVPTPLADAAFKASITHPGYCTTHEHHSMSAMLSVSCASSFSTSLPEMQAASQQMQARYLQDDTAGAGG